MIRSPRFHRLHLYWKDARLGEPFRSAITLWGQETSTEFLNVVSYGKSGLDEGTNCSTHVNVRRVIYNQNRRR
jgi:hypothetical protein